MSTAQNSQVNGDSTAVDANTIATPTAILNSASSGATSNTIATLIEPSSNPSTTGTSKASVTDPSSSPSGSPAPPSTTVPQVVVTTLVSISTTTPITESATPSSTSAAASSTTDNLAPESASIHTSTASSTVGATQALSPSSAPSSAPANGSSPAGVSKKGVSNAAAIGGGVGGGVVLLLLLLMAALIYRQKRRRDVRPQMDEVSRGNKPMSRHRSSPIDPVAGTYNAWNDLLPQPLDDETLAGEVRSLLDQIGLHVDNVYARKEMQLTKDMLDALASVDTNLLSSALPDMMQIPALQVFVIKHCIAYAITSRMSPSQDSIASLIPPHIAVLPSRNGAQGEEKRADALQQAYSQWRVLTAYLFPDSRNEELAKSERHKATTDIVNTVSTAFAKWENDQEVEGSSKDHLGRLTELASSTGLMLSSQASSLQFTWRVSSRHARDEGAEYMVVLPGLSKLSDERGIVLRHAQTIVRPVTQKIRDRA
nr:hypothetical protein B0A51_04502 [Rachicladosporium sp. CCFEE 5018]